MTVNKGHQSVKLKWELCTSSGSSWAHDLDQRNKSNSEELACMVSQTPIHCIDGIKEHASDVKLHSGAESLCEKPLLHLGMADLHHHRFLRDPSL